MVSVPLVLRCDGAQDDGQCPTVVHISYSSGVGGACLPQWGCVPLPDGWRYGRMANGYMTTLCVLCPTCAAPLNQQDNLAAEAWIAARPA